MQYYLESVSKDVTTICFVISITKELVIDLD